MNRKFSIIILALTGLMLTSCMSVSFSGDYVLREGDTLRGSLFVTSGSVTLEEKSRVTGTIMLTSGELHLGKNAWVGEDVVLTSGELFLADGAVIQGNVVLASADIKVHQAPGATVKGSLTTNIAPFVISLATKGLLLYCVLPIVILIALILALGTWLGRQSKKRVQTAQAPAMVTAEDTKSRLQYLKKMLAEGLITETDYEAKKSDILSTM